MNSYVFCVVQRPVYISENISIIPAWFTRKFGVFLDTSSPKREKCVRITALKALLFKEENRKNS